MGDFLKAVVSFFIVLSPLVLLHELGHFMFAKRAGIRVLEFGLFYPPRARRLWRGMGRMMIGSTWVHTPRNFTYPARLADGVRVEAHAGEVKGRLMLNSITVIAGEPDAAEPPRDPASDSLYRDDVSGRVGVSGQASSLDWAAEAVHLRGEVGHFDPGTEYSINWLPLGGFVRMSGEEDPSAPDSFAAAPKRDRTAVLLAGPGMNFVAAFVIFCLAFMLGQPTPDKLSVAIEYVAPNSPAQQSGIVPGMTVLAVNGIAVDSTDVLTNFTRSHLDQTIQLKVRNADGSVRELGVFARSQRPADQGPMGITIGVRAESYKLVYRSLPDAASESMRATARAAEGIITLPSKLISGQIEPSQARPVGPAGIAQLTGFALDASINQGVLFPLLQMAGVISIALGVTNLLPLPALDGGRLVFVLIEAVRGKRISPEKEAMVHFAGLMFLLALTLLITIQDVSNPLVNPF